MAKTLDLVPVTEWGFFTLPRPMVIAGPCSAESEEQVMETARDLAARGIHVFRAGIWKPRTHPGHFEGVGTPGLKWLKRVKEETGMKTAEIQDHPHSGSGFWLHLVLDVVVAALIVGVFFLFLRVLPEYRQSRKPDELAVEENPVSAATEPAESHLEGTADISFEPSASGTIPRESTSTPPERHGPRGESP